MWTVVIVVVVLWCAAAVVVGTTVGRALARRDAVDEPMTERPADRHAA